MKRINHFIIDETIILSMGVREVKKKLNGMDKTEIIKLISEMYKKLPTAKDYLDIYAAGDVKGLT